MANTMTNTMTNTMAIMTTIKYNLSLKQKAPPIKILLPSLLNKVLTSIVLKCNNKEISLKLTGDNNAIFQCGETLLSYSNVLSLKPYTSLLLNSKNVEFSISNVSNAQRGCELFDVLLEFYFDNLDDLNLEQKVIYENIFSSHDKEILNSIVKDIKSLCHNAHKFVFTNVKRVNFKSQFEIVNDNNVVDDIDMLSDDNNNVEFKTPLYFKDDINYYNLNIEPIDNESQFYKYGLIIYGY